MNLNKSENFAFSDNNGSPFTPSGAGLIKVCNTTL